MFCNSVIIALVSSAICVSAAPGLSLKVTGPRVVNGASNFKVTTVMTNTGDEELRLINNPLTPLSTIPAKTFNIMNAAGESPDFTGVKAKFVPERAIALGFFTTLAPGESKIVEHDLFRAYDFSTSGEGAYKVEARNGFHMIKDDKLVPIFATSEVHTAKISGSLSDPTPVGRIGRRAKFNSCSDSEQAQINDAIPAAQNYASDAYSYLVNDTASGPRYTTWFGVFDQARHDTVTEHFKNISSRDFASYTYDCSCNETATFAYVYPNAFGTIYLCGAFWTAPKTGTDSKAGTFIHENSHFIINGGTEDHVYGQTDARALAKSDPTQAIDNADNHEYFAENDPHLS